MGTDPQENFFRDGSVGQPVSAHQVEMEAGSGGVPCCSPLVIEFFGPPGAGKSTLASEIAAQLRESESSLIYSPDYLADETGKAARALRKVGIILSSGLDREELALIGQAAQFSQSSVSDRIRAVSTLATALALYKKLDKEGRPAVVDQGLLQAAFSVMYRCGDGESEAFIDALVERAAESHHIHVAVRVPREVCMTRLHSRQSKHSRMQSTDDADWMRAERIIDAIWGKLGSTYEKAGRTAYAIIVDGTLPPETSANRLCKQFHAIRHGEVCE